MWGDVTHTFFGGDVTDKLHPYNPLSEMHQHRFDVILGSPDQGGIDLIHFFQSVESVLTKMKSRNFLTCLNLNKLSVLASLICFCPDSSSIVEVGAYQCGTSIFMAKLAKALGKKITIYACDTFAGMPAATAADYVDSVAYDSGMFMDNPIEKVQKRIYREKVADCIHLVKGDVAKTLPNLDCKNVYMMFLDTDQYKGTKIGLDLVKNLQTPHVVIDDTILSGVNSAIEEFIWNNPNYKRENLFTNFDYVYKSPSQKSK
jgi:hypothetical protein